MILSAQEMAGKRLLLRAEAARVLRVKQGTRLPAHLLSRIEMEDGRWIVRVDRAALESVVEAGKPPAPSRARILGQQWNFEEHAAILRAGI